MQLFVAAAAVCADFPRGSATSPETKRLGARHRTEKCEQPVEWIAKSSAHAYRWKILLV